MKNISDNFWETQNTFSFKQFFFFFENVSVHEIMWKIIVERGRPQMTMWRMRIACWIPKATNTHSQYVIIIAFPLQQWFHEIFSMLRYTYIAACLVTFLHFTFTYLYFIYFHISIYRRIPRMWRRSQYNTQYVCWITDVITIQMYIKSTY